MFPGDSAEFFLQQYPAPVDPRVQEPDFYSIAVLIAESWKPVRIVRMLAVQLDIASAFSRLSLNFLPTVVVLRLYLPGWLPGGRSSQ